MADFIKILDKPALYQAADTDNIKAVVGGVNTEHFAPSVNVSFKMQSGVEQYFFNICDDPDQVQTIGKTEVQAGDKLAVQDGEIVSTFTLSETSLKIERVFYQKPTQAPRYKLAFSPGVSFHYQDTLENDYARELGEWLTAGGLVENFPLGSSLEDYLSTHGRPDNVVGSYAVRCDQKGHYKNADGSTRVNYGTGKIGHLYAPYWTDSSGKKIKGTQEIIGNILTFALPPQEWIDSAVLPVTLDPDVGYTTAGSSFTAVSGNYAFYAGTFSPTSSGTLDSIEAYLRVDADISYTFGVYGVATSAPDNLIAVTAGGDVGTGISWRQQALGDEEIISGDDYFLALNHESGDTGRFFYDTGSLVILVESDLYVAGSLPDPADSGAHATSRDHSIFATYTEDSGVLPNKLIPIFQDQSVSFIGKKINSGSVNIIAGSAAVGNLGKEGLNGLLSSLIESSEFDGIGADGLNGVIDLLANHIDFDSFGKIGAIGKIEIDMALIVSLFGFEAQEIFTGIVDLSFGDNILSSLGNEGKAGKISTQIENMISLLTGLKGNSGITDINIFTTAELFAKIGLTGLIDIALIDNDIKLIEVTISQKIFKILISTKTGQIKILEPKTGSITIN